MYCYTGLFFSRYVFNLDLCSGSMLMSQIFKLVLAVPNGFFIFFNPPVFGWYLSSTAVVLIGSWSLHNVIAWIKNKPFLDRTTSRIYIGTVVLIQGYWILEIYANFTYFNNINEHLFVSTRPYEALCRYDFTMPPNRY